MQGMPYEDVRARIKKLKTQGGNPQLKANLKESLINQARLREGEGAAREIHKELNYIKKYY